jgi:cyclophilin family peptidyl-prolyl cis-trans isomerase
MRLLHLLVLLLTLLIAPSLSAQTPAGLEAVVTTDLGTFRFEFYPDKAPKHVDQFIRLARQGYYDGSAFHRVVANGIVQGGDPLLKNPKTPRSLWGTGGLNLLAGESSDLKHERGVVSTVRIPGKPDSDGAQFFVCVVPQPSLDGQFSAFGRVTEGMDVVERVSQVPVGADGITDTPVRILKVTIENKKVQPYLSATPDEMRKTVTLNTTLGVIKIKMEPDWAPENVRNFLMLASTGWYNGTVFPSRSEGFCCPGGNSGTALASGGSLDSSRKR